ncbi:hypothetical protein NLX67_21760 [Domibacillus sp. A3M-37]|uniref:hypothetical protein n=1 Tax=Domibacillus sp. A3M-37 TaxID=2962037 RepID=UPI0020B8B6D0|nr:hypothetical protein [Domibacillus sp. A3M-37]MCP3764943.1 hypothetical protein [Domibacillus sp. A3M-37]
MSEEKKLTVKNIPVYLGKNNTPAKERRVEPVRSLSAKLNPEYDKDLMDALTKIPKRERSKLYRDAVRLYLKQNLQ